MHKKKYLILLLKVNPNVNSNKKFDFEFAQYSLPHSFRAFGCVHWLNSNYRSNYHRWTSVASPSVIIINVFGLMCLFLAHLLIMMRLERIVIRKHICDIRVCLIEQ